MIFKLCKLFYCSKYYRILVPPRGSSRVTVELFPSPENTNGLVNTVTLAGQTNDGGYVTRAALVRVRKEVTFYTFSTKKGPLMYLQIRRKMMAGTLTAVFRCPRDSVENKTITRTLV